MKALLVLALGWLLLVAGAAPASANDYLGLSLDGRTWSTRLAQPLFDPAVRWVPGDVRSARFYVRNQGPSRARLQVVAHTDRPAPAYAEAIRLRVRADGGAWTDLPIGGAGLKLSRLLGRGGVEQVEVDAGFDPASRNDTQQRSLRLTFDLRLTDAGVPMAGPAHGSAPSLPNTGSDVSPGFVELAGLLLASGLALIFRSLLRSRKARP